MSSTFNHSERVLLHTLKDKKNVEQILKRLSDHDAIKYGLKLMASMDNKTYLVDKYIIYAVSLFFYSYPNSVCHECSLGFIALQNSYNEGFLKLLIDITSETNSIFTIIGFNKEQNAQNIQNKSPFQLTVVGASAKAYDIPNSYDPFINNHPDSKLKPQSQLEQGIELRRKDNGQSQCFYEFINDNIHESSLSSIPFEGNIFISGLKPPELKEIETIFKDIPFFSSSDSKKDSTVVTTVSISSSDNSVTNMDSEDKCDRILNCSSVSGTKSVIFSDLSIKDEINTSSKDVLNKLGPEATKELEYLSKQRQSNGERSASASASVLKK